MNQTVIFNQQEILDHAKNPRNYGLRIGADIYSKLHNPSCGDLVQICAFIENGKITQLYFEGTGCLISLAMASKLTQYVSGMDVNQIIKLDEQLIQKLLNTELGINRLQCGMLSVRALQQGTRDFCALSNC